MDVRLHPFVLGAQRCRVSEAATNSRDGGRGLRLQYVCSARALARPLVLFAVPLGGGVTSHLAVTSGTRAVQLYSTRRDLAHDAGSASVYRTCAIASQRPRRHPGSHRRASPSRAGRRVTSPRPPSSVVDVRLGVHARRPPPRGGQRDGMAATGAASTSTSSWWWSWRSRWPRHRRRCARCRRGAGCPRIGGRRRWSAPGRPARALCRAPASCSVGSPCSSPARWALQTLL